VKYMLLIYNNPDALEALADADRNSLMAEVDQLMDELTTSGELVGGEALAHPAAAKTVRLQGGVVATTDGPFLEAKELLAGYAMVEVENEERAVEIARRWPDARMGGAMEVRAVMDTAGMEM
jgi:hypothetical protein